jgi:hypothetical protein
VKRLALKGIKLAKYFKGRWISDWDMLRRGYIVARRLQSSIVDAGSTVVWYTYRLGEMSICIS